MKKVFLILSLSLLSILGTKAQEHKASAYPTEKTWLITTKPQTLFLGFNLGAEYVISPKLSWHSELTSHLHTFDYRSTALKTSLKWHFLGHFGKSLYLEPKLVAGFFHDYTPIDDKPYYAGIGLGLGAMHSISKNKRWFLFYEAGVKTCEPFGYRKDSSPDNDLGIIDYLFISPSSLYDLAIGISYRL